MPLGAGDCVLSPCLGCGRSLLTHFSLFGTGTHHCAVTRVLERKIVASERVIDSSGRSGFACAVSLGAFLFPHCFDIDSSALTSTRPLKKTTLTLVFLPPKRPCPSLRRRYVAPLLCPRLATTFFLDNRARRFSSSRDFEEATT